MLHPSPRRWLILRSSLLLAALACGSDSDGDDDGDAALCTTFAACGGDPTGTWESADLCLPDDAVSSAAGALPPECEGALTVEASSRTTLTIAADGTLSEAGSGSVQVSARFDQECIGATAGRPVEEADVAIFCDAYREGINTGDSPFSDTSCQVTNAICSCTSTQQVDIDEGGQVTVAGNLLVYPGGTGSVQREFCVEGDQLRLAALDGAGLPGAYQIYIRTSP
jgi:hypothetical protein